MLIHCFYCMIVGSCRLRPKSPPNSIPDVAGSYWILGPGLRLLLRETGALVPDEGRALRFERAANSGEGRGLQPLAIEKPQGSYISRRAGNQEQRPNDARPEKSRGCRADHAPARRKRCGRRCPTANGRQRRRLANPAAYDGRLVLTTGQFHVDPSPATEDFGFLGKLGSPTQPIEVFFGNLSPSARSNLPKECVLSEQDDRPQREHRTGGSDDRISRRETLATIYQSHRLRNQLPSGFEPRIFNPSRQTGRGALA